MGFFSHISWFPLVNNQDVMLFHGPACMHTSFSSLSSVVWRQMTCCNVIYMWCFKQSYEFKLKIRTLFLYYSKAVSTFQSTKTKSSKPQSRSSSDQVNTALSSVKVTVQINIGVILRQVFFFFLLYCTTTTQELRFPNPHLPNTTLTYVTMLQMCQYLKAVTKLFIWLLRTAGIFEMVQCTSRESCGTLDSFSDSSVNYFSCFVF